MSFVATRALGALGSMIALAAGCSSPSASPATPPDAGADAAPATRSVCLLSDQHGDLDDRTYIYTASQGLAQIHADLGWNVDYVQPDDSTYDAFATKMTSLIAKRYDLIVVVSPLYGDVVQGVALSNPDQRFEALDFAPQPPLGNVWGQSYAVNEATFLAGYLAAGVSHTGKVAVFGGADVVAIEQFMDGFALGVKHYDDVHQAQVEVLGWDVASRHGAFIGTFTDASKAQTQTNDLLTQGADVIFPVAGGAAYGAGDAVVAHGSAYVIGVDVDWALQPAYANVALTSILKRLDQSERSAVQAIDDSAFVGENHTGTLANGQVDLAPFHGLDAIVPAALKSELADVRSQITAGTLKTTP